MSAWLLAPLALTLLAHGGWEAAALRQSGLYVDNGMDQTLMHRVVSQREKGEVEQEILSLLGLPERPPRHAGLGGPPQVRRSAPKFLLDIYKGVLGEAQPERPLGLSGQELRAIDQSDAIMTFAAHNGHVPGVRHERGKRLWFNVSEAPANERLLGAELRLYRSPPRHRPALPFTLTAYRVLRLQDGQRELQFVDSVNASAGHEGWLALNASAPLRHWLAQPAAANRGLYLSVHPADGRPHELRPEDVGLVAFRGPADKQPFLVGFFKSSPASVARHQQRPRAKRELGRGSDASGAKRAQGPGPSKKHKPDVSSLEYRGNPYTEPQLQYNSRTCRIQTLYVSFRDLQWQDWIIAPDGYDAYYCSGECNFPLNAHMNATNHAIVQTLVHLVNPGKVPKPCCAPTKLSPISVLYFLDESNVILKKYKNMVVKSCGCH